MAKKRATISACLITKDEEAFLGKALRNVAPYVDEIIVVDGGSTDDTVAIAQKFGAKTYHHRFTNDFSKQRNVSLRYATKDWILVIDADETFEKKALESLQAFAANDIGVDMVAIPRRNYIDGKLTEAYPDRQLRFFPNRPSIRWQGRVHEKPAGWKRLLAPSDMNIIHRKTSQRQQVQNARYDKILAAGGADARGPSSQKLI